MARSLSSKPNIVAPDGTYPYGRIKDKTSTSGGTPVNELVYGDFHQFFSKLMAESGITPNDLPDNAVNGFQLYDALLSISGGLRTIVVPIGDWNMDTNANINVDIGDTIGLYSEATAQKIRSVSVMVRGDVDAGAMEDFMGGLDAFAHLDLLNYGGKWCIGANAVPPSGGLYIGLSREDSSVFDSTIFDSISYNRGYITIQYLP